MIYDYKRELFDGKVQNLADYKGKVLLVVNTATGCGFTPQYEELEALYNEFKDQGFEILDFPCNQFAEQAKESDAEIHQICQLRYNTSFPQFKKVEVNGEAADPIFVELAQAKPFKGFGRSLKAAALGIAAKANNKKFGDAVNIGWNFTKFLLDREGKVIERFEPTRDMAEVKRALKECL